MRFQSAKRALAALDADEPVGLQITDAEDMWHAYNLIQVGDVVSASSPRKVMEQTTTGSSATRTVYIMLSVKVTKTDFDPLASDLRISGQVVSENPYVSIGQYHTIKLRYDKEHDPKFSIWKPHGWDSVARDMLKEALCEEQPDAMIAIVMQEGLANICVITRARTLVKQRIEASVSKKRSTSKEIDSGLNSFFDKILTALLTAFDNIGSRTLLLASPGFTAQNFRNFMKDRAARTGDKSLMLAARNALAVHSSTGHVHSLNEVLKSSEVHKVMQDTKYISETAMMDKFYERFRKDDGRAWYGVKPVTKAIKEGAVGRGGGVLFINNSLFRSMDIAERKRYVELVDKVKADGGEALVLSSDHESGQRLDALGGIACMLTYPIFDLDEDDDEEEEKEEAANQGSAEGTTVI